MCHSRRTATGRSLVQPAGIPAIPSIFQVPEAARLNMPVPPPSWKPTWTGWGAVTLALKVSIAQYRPDVASRAPWTDPGTTPAMSAAGKPRYLAYRLAS
jgi:hypothetical protein